MKRLWLVTNAGSGTTDDRRIAAVIEAIAQAGLALVGRSDFPGDTLPDPGALDAAGADCVAVLAGDGTINAVLGRLSAWPGSILILPGGTMNLLARALHGDVAPDSIIARAVGGAPRIAVPCVEVAGHRGYVGVIIGPAAHWFRAREAVRRGWFARLVRAARHAWARSFARGVRIGGVPGMRRRVQAVLLRPLDGMIEVAAIDAREWRSIVGLGWSWITGDWMAAQAVSVRCSPQLWVRGRRPVLALFDGEPVLLKPGARIRPTMTAAGLIATRPMLSGAAP